MKRIIILLIVVAMSSVSFGLREEKIGPDSASHPTLAQPGWPKGIVEPLRHGSRVYSIWFNGNENFYFKAEPDEINELIEQFSRARLRDHEVWIEFGTKEVKSFRGDVFEYNVSLQILSGIALSVLKDSNEPDTFEPELRIYVDDVSALKKLKLPDNLIVHCSVEGANIKSRAVKPERRRWCGIVQFHDSSPAVDFQSGLSTQITLWQEGFKDGFPIDRVDGRGDFSIALSDKEMADLKNGKSRLTITTGNFLTESSRSDEQFPAELLSLEKGKAIPKKISWPKFYYGRILFEDGSIPVLDPEPWPGAEISVSFPYAGSPRIDSQGYFRVYFSEEQIEKLKTDKQRSNIYVPSYVERGSARAVAVFPADLLSQDKSKAGVVKIPKPGFEQGVNLGMAPPLTGKSLPDIKSLGVSLSGADNKKVLICFWDFQQRPSRNMISQLASGIDELINKGVAVALVQAAQVEQGELEEYISKNNIKFPLGIIKTDVEKIRYNWGVRSLPWLILTDENHIVKSEGFTINELDENLKKQIQKLNEDKK